MSNYLIESFTHEGMTIKIYQDSEPMSSPADWDTLGTLVTFPALSREYSLGNRESTSNEDLALGVSEYGSTTIAKHNGWELLRRYLSITEGAECIPFRFVDYGSGSCRIHKTDGDSDRIPGCRISGFIYCDRYKIVSEYGDDSAFSRDKARELLSAELKTWNQYVQGEVYGFVVSDPDGNITESLWGIYDDEYRADEGQTDCYLYEEAKSSAWATAHEYRQKRENWSLAIAKMSYGMDL